MNKFLYPKLALTNIKNNSKIYIPYLLTCIGTVMMYYIMYSLSIDKALEGMRGGMQTKQMLSLGTGVIAIFVTIFLFYTNSFIIKRRKKEFGLFNILGMEKKHISRVMFIETLYTAIISLTIGLLCGILFSKLVLLFLLKLLNFDVRFGFAVSFKAINSTLILFGVIFILTLLNNLRQVSLSNPIELLKGGQTGEKEPKTKWLLTIIGVLALGGGYYIAVSSTNVIAAISLFFVAVILVIIGTYCLFTAGSIAFLKILRKNKSYYYKTKHFISVSGMIYRMKQNAAGLANICILSTMVLVMVSSTVALYVGMDDALRSRYPREITIETYSNEESPLFDSIDYDGIATDTNDILARYNAKPENLLSYRYSIFSVIQKENNFVYKIPNEFDQNVKILLLIPLDDYNKLTGTNETLDENEVLLYSNREAYGYNNIKAFGEEYIIKKTLTSFISNGNSQMNIASTYYVVVKDIDVIENAILSQWQDDDARYKAKANYFYGFDLDIDKDEQIKVYDDLWQNIMYDNGYIRVESSAEAEGEFYGLYGGLFFLGIFLGLLFVMATVLIMYYKQISEGYDDKDRFEIMQNVGMSKSEVKNSIRSQVLTVFFLPLLTAGVHIAFAFPIITRLLAVLNLTNISLFAASTIISFLIFAVFYAFVYSITARSYYKIVR